VTRTTGRQGDIGKRGPKGLKGLRGSLHPRDVLETVVTHCEDVYRQPTALQKQIDRIEQQLPPIAGG
jgi:hypothetical protein